MREFRSYDIPALTQKTGHALNMILRLQIESAWNQIAFTWLQVISAWNQIVITWNQINSICRKIGSTCYRIDEITQFL